MKHNKSLKKIVYPLVAILVVLFAACGDDGGIDPPPAELQGTTIDGHAYEADPQLSFVLEGSTAGVVSTIDTEGTSSNPRFSNFRLTQSHMAYINTTDIVVDISEGEFVIDGVDETTLYGDYTGTGRFENGYFTGVLTLNIKGGTGLCSRASGSIVETIELSDKLDAQMEPIGFYIDFAGVYCSPN